MENPHEERAKKLAADVVLGAIFGASEEELLEAIKAHQAEQEDILLPEGRGRLSFGTGKVRKTLPATITCDDCGKILHSDGGGISFDGGPGDPMYQSEEDWLLGCHRSSLDNGCPAVKWRWWRWSHNRSPWAKMDRKLKSWLWRHNKSRRAKVYWKMARMLRPRRYRR